MPIVEPKTITMLSKLEDKNYSIPEYQRGYSWDEDNISDFLFDIEELKLKKEDTHFFGMIVVHKGLEANRVFVVDGQQRIITTLLFLAVLKKYFNLIATDFTASDSAIIAMESAKEIQTKYLQDLNNSNNVVDIHKNSQECFNNILNNKKPKKKPYFVSAKNLVNNYEKFDNYLRETYDSISKSSKDGSDVLKMITSYYNAVKKIDCIFIVTDNDMEAFSLFEGLNSKGMDLKASDLLKNFIFKKVNNLGNDALITAKNNWENMIENVGETNVSRFIRYYWISSRDFVREKKLYKKVKEEISSNDDALKLSEDLSRYSYYYNQLLNPTDDDLFTNNAKKSLQNLNLLNFKNYSPLVLSLLEREVGGRDLEELLDAIETLVFRYQLIAGKSSNTLEIKYSEIANTVLHDFRNRKGLKDHILNDIKAFIEDNIPDKSFISNFEAMIFTNAKIAKYTLFKIENKSYGESVKEDYYKIHLEHIIPETLGPSYEYLKEKEDYEKYEKYVDRLGNMTLLDNELHGPLSNGGISGKYEMYKNKSKLNLNKDIVSHLEKKYKEELDQNKDFSKMEWEFKDIEERQKALAKKAAEIWKIK